MQLIDNFDRHLPNDYIDTCHGGELRAQVKRRWIANMTSDKVLHKLAEWDRFAGFV